MITNNNITPNNITPNKIFTLSRYKNNMNLSQFLTESQNNNDNTNKIFDDAISIKISLSAIRLVHWY